MKGNSRYAKQYRMKVKVANTYVVGTAFFVEWYLNDELSRTANVIKKFF